jgi:Tol biopolymer transport system component
MQRIKTIINTRGWIKPAGLLVGCMLLGLSTNLSAALSQDPSLHWQTLTTPHFEIHFHDGEEPLAREVGAISEQVHEKLSKEFNWEPRERTQVILTDRFDYANGSATPMPRNTMRLLVTPPTGNSVIADHDGWMELLITHEYTHILHLDKVSGLPASLQKVFGRNLFLFPNALQPPWFIEGLATYEETDVARGIGRGQGSLFRGYMREEVLNGIKPIHQANQPLTSWPTNTVRYLYGVYFYQFIAERYGEDKPMQLVTEYSNNLIPFAINNNSKKVLGKDMTALWDEFSEYLKEKFSPEIKQIKQAGVVAGTQLTHSGYVTRSPQFAENGDIYYLQNDLQSEPRLMRLQNGTTTPVADVRGASFDLHADAGIIGTEINAVDNVNYFSDIYHLNIDSGEKTELTHGKRYLQAVWSADGKNIIAIHNQLGQHALHLLNISGEKIETLWQGEDNTVISSIDASPDGTKLVAAVWRPASLWNLEIFDINTRQWTLLTKSTAIENSPRFSDDGKRIVFSADYDGVFNIYQLSLADHTLSKLSNVIGEANSPALHKTANGEQLAYINLTANGYDLFRIDKITPSAAPTVNEPVTRRTAKNTLPRQHAPVADTTIEPYNALTRVAPTSWFPYFQIDDERSEIGFTTFGHDPLQRHTYNLLLGYDTDNQWGIGRFNYIYDRWNPTLKFSLSREVLTYLDNAGDVGLYRDSDTLSAEAVWPFFRYERQWLLHAGMVSETESDKKVLPTIGPVATNKDQLLGVAVSYNSAQKYVRSISPSYGRQVRLVAEDDDTLDSDYSGQVYTLDWRELVDLPGQHVFAARAVLGWGTDSPRPFRLGGTLDTSVPPVPQSATALTENIFGHRRYPLHGYKQGRADLRGRRMALVEAEWRFPIALIERGFMAPPIGLHQLHGKLFYNWGESWNQSSDIPALRRGAGVELTTELVLGYWLPMNVRFGFAKGFDLGGEEQAYVEARVPFL